MTEPGGAPSQAPTRRGPRRLWSLQSSHQAHGATEELAAIARTVGELGWLLLALVLGYLALARSMLSGTALAALLGGACAYAGAMLALQWLAGQPQRGRWSMLGRCWAMTALVTWLLLHAEPHRMALAQLYNFVVIASAMALSHRATLLNFGLIAAAIALVWLPGDRESAAAVALLLAPMALVAYVVTRLAADIRRTIERIRFISDTDELTRLYNLRAFMQIAERLHRQAKRYTRPYALVMLDSDNLKSVNDTHGHQAGNELLKLTTTCIRRELRETDVAARYGGDEFILLLPETGGTGARELGERIRRSVNEKGLELRGMRIAISVSVGIAAFPEHGADLRSIMNKSDQAMYLSKRTGRNRVTLFDPG